MAANRKHHQTVRFYMSPTLILVMCLALTSANMMKVMLKVDDTTTDSGLSGSDVEIISDLERRTFKLDYYQLKDAVRKFFGKYPDRAYLHSPTFGNIYKSFHWNQVTRVMKPHQVTFLGMHTNPEILLKRKFYNGGPTPATFHIETCRIVTNKISTTWAKSNSFTIGAGIDIGASVKMLELGTHVNLEHTTTWGNEETHSQSVTIGDKEGLSVVLNPGESVIAILSANYGTMKFKVDYTASLKGYVAVTYPEPYQGHYFWGLNIEELMESADISNCLLRTAITEIKFYSDGGMKVLNESTSAVIAQREGKNMTFLKFHP